MRLASFNIKNGLSDDGSCDPDALVVACRRLRADVLALQEVDRGVPRSNGADQTSIVANGCGLTGIYAPARRLDGGQYGNALLARGSFVDVEHVLSHCPKCMIRSGLWQPEMWPDTSALPTFAETLIAHAKLAESVDAVQAIIEEGNRERLY